MLKSRFITSAQYHDAINTPIKINPEKHSKYQNIYTQHAVRQACQFINGTEKDLADCVIYTYYDQDIQDILKSLLIIFCLKPKISAAYCPNMRAL